MIKVIEFVGALKDGGAETLVKDYVEVLDKKRFDARVLTVFPMKNTANYRQAVKDGAKIISVYRSYNIVVRAINKILGRWYVPRRLKQILRAEAPNCIHIHSPLAWTFAAIRSELKDIDLFYTCHSEPKKYFRCGEKGEEVSVRQLVQENKMRLVALHEDMRKELNTLFAVEDAVVVNNGVNFKRYNRPQWDAGGIRESVGIDKDAFLIVHVGRFAAVKNHAFLLDVFGEIKKMRADAHLLLVGDGPLKANICEKVKQKNLTGNVTMLSHRTDVPELMYASDLVVFPSLYEGLSVTLVEAQVTGLRCIVSDSVNQANFLTEKTIPMSLQLDAQKWAEIALDESVKNAAFGDLSRFNIEHEIQKLESLYTKVEGNG